MKRRLFVASLALAALAVVGLAGSAAAGEFVPFQGVLEGIDELVAPPPSAVIHGVGRGQATQLGRFTYDFDATVEDRSERTALIAPQGPRAAELLATLTDLDLASLGYYRSQRGTVAGTDCLVARTGYTGEDGFELFCDARRATRLWDALLEAGAPFGLKPCGLGSRDTLRLEAGMPLYGNELGRDVNPYEANLGRVVKLDKGEFMGRAALASVQQSGPARKLVGLVMRDNAIARHGYAVQVDGAEAGLVTSGTVSPTLGEPIAMAYLPAAAATVGGEVEVIVRDRPHRAEQVKLPFYKRPKPDAG